MNKANRIIILAISLFSILPRIAWSAADESPDQLAIEQERRLGEEARTQAQLICDSIFGKGLSNVIVSVEVGLQSDRKGGSAFNQKRDNKSQLGAENYILPWVPAPKSVTKEETPKDASVETQAAQQASLDVKTIVKRFDITVIHDSAIAEDRVAIVKDMLASAFDRYKTILKIFFRAASFLHPGATNPKDEVKKNLWDFLKPIHLILLGLLLLCYLLLKFLFGPLAEFMKSYISGMKEQSKSKVEMENTSQTENETDENAENEDNLGEGEMTPEELEALEAQAKAEEEAMQKFTPFTYINDENIKQLAYLLHHEEPWVVALVLSYLTSEHGYKVMEALPPELQARVALETAMYRQTSLDQVMTIDADIKEKIDFVVGGLGKLVGILENSDRFARENILEYLKNEKPGLFERVREQILLFDDIVNFPKVAMQILVRELKTEDLGRALRGTSPEMQQKFFDNMSQGAATLLKEEIQYGRPSTEDQVEEERRKIIDYIKALENEGKISFRQRGKNTAISGDEMGSALPGSDGVLDAPGSEEAYQAGLLAQQNGVPEEALAHFEKAVQLNSRNTGALQALAGALYEAGRLPEAITRYEAALAIEPNDELRVWVDNLKSSMQAAA